MQPLPLSVALSTPFAIAERPSSSALQREGRVRYLAVYGSQDDGLWGPLGAMWLSEDRRRGGFLVNPWAIWAGSEVARGYRGARSRGWTPERIFGYWKTEVWPGSHSVDDEQEAETLAFLAELVDEL